VVGEEGGFLVGAGACARAEEPALATKMKPKKVDRIREGMRLDESPGLRIPRERERHKSRIRAKLTEPSAKTEDALCSLRLCQAGRSGAAPLHAGKVS